MTPAPVGTEGAIWRKTRLSAACLCLFAVAASGQQSPSPPVGKSGPAPIRDLATNNRIWPNGVIPYEIDPGFPFPANMTPDVGDDIKEKIDIAIKAWNYHSVIQLRPRSGEYPFLSFLSFRFTPDVSHCYAGVGYYNLLVDFFNEDANTVNLKKSCNAVTIAHEIGHAVSLFHEHQRTDRDRFVDIHPSFYGEAYKANRDPVEKSPYDYTSVMHYQRGFQTIPPGITIARGGVSSALYSGVSNAPRDSGLSPGDIDGVARLYSGSGPELTTITTNPPGLDIIVDGVRETTPHSVSPGTYTLKAPLVQHRCANRYLFGNWGGSGGNWEESGWGATGNDAATITVNAGGDTTWFQANFIEQPWDYDSDPEGYSMPWTAKPAIACAAEDDDCLKQNPLPRCTIQDQPCWINSWYTNSAAHDDNEIAAWPRAFTFVSTAGAGPEDAPEAQSFWLTNLKDSSTFKLKASGRIEFLSIVRKDGEGSPNPLANSLTLEREETVEVWIAPPHRQSLLSGLYQGNVSVCQEGSDQDQEGSDPCLDIPVHFVVVPDDADRPPSTNALCISPNGISPATGTPVVNSISPNAMISVFGQEFAPQGTRALAPELDTDGRVAAKLAGACLEIDGRRAPLFEVTPNRINAQAPHDLTPGQAEARVIRGCGTANAWRSPAETVAVRTVSPAFFNFVSNPDGRNPIRAFHGDGNRRVGAPELGAEFTPAEPGEVVTLYGTGFGTTEPALETGEIAAGTVDLANEVSFTFGGIAVPPADILYAGAAPGRAGVYQFKVRLPSNLPDGDAAVVATVNGVSTPTGPFLTVRRQVANGGMLTPGQPAHFRLGPVDNPTIFVGGSSYRLEVPANATRVTFSLQPNESVDMDMGLRVRFGENIARGQDRRWIADYVSRDRSRNNERIVITRSSDPPLRAGTYYASLVLWDTGVVAEGTLTATIETGQSGQGMTPGEVFHDCDECPEMVVIPAGSFEMGSPESEEGREDDEGPQHEVTIPRAFAVGAYEVTFEEWDACVATGGCGGYRPDDVDWGRGRRPVIHVSWEDAQGYVEWLSRKTGKQYRLLSEAEWEYAARAGTTTRFSFGDSLSPNDANYDLNIRKTQPVGSYRANGFGLYDMHGNAWEWVQDCWNGSYEGAPSNGNVWERGDCGRRVLRGGSWNNHPRYLRAAARQWHFAGFGDVSYGFRVARTLTATEESAPPTVRLTASPASIRRGESATLRWSSTNTESARIDQGIGSVATSGSRSVSPTSTTTYRITVTSEDGRTATASARVTVTAAPPPNRAGDPLTPGQPAPFHLGPVDDPTIFVGGGYSYRLDIPANATRVTFSLQPNESVDMGLRVRFGENIARGQDRSWIADYVSRDRSRNNERIVITRSSDPPLRAGTYYAALVLWDTGVVAEGTLTATIETGQSGQGMAPGEVFYDDCAGCPEMVVIPAGSFEMGSPENEEGREDDEGPQHEVTIPRAFAVGAHEVTVGEYAAFAVDTGYEGETGCWTWTGSEWQESQEISWRNPGYSQTGWHPVACVSWEDARAYVRWLSRKTGEEYRLLSEAEWEYAARAGTRTRYSFGDAITPNDANYGRNIRKTQPVGSYRANEFGLYDMHGNVWEWVQDCQNGSYAGAPMDGSAWERGDCSRRVWRGGSWLFNPRVLRAANRGGFVTGGRSYDVGFRVARTLTATGESAPPTVRLTASPASIRRGESATLRWSSTNTASARIDQGIGSVATSGSRSVSPTSTTTYRITVTSEDGRTATDSVRVTVTAAPPSNRAGGPLTPGQPAPFRLGPRDLDTTFRRTIYIGNNSFRLEVPANAAGVTFILNSANPDVNTDLFVRFEEDNDVQDGRIVSDYSSETASGNERIVITRSSNPPLRSGTYYASLALSDKGIVAEGTLTATIETGQSGQGMAPGEVFYDDCAGCPEMVVIPAGSFVMGSPESEEGREDDEGPQHEVTIPRAFAVGAHEVTVGEYAAFAVDTGYEGETGCWTWTGSEWQESQEISWRNPGYSQTGWHPVACVSWEDARAYVRWLSRKTGEEYRLLSEAEWEYAARAGSRTRYSFGDRITPNDANYGWNIRKTQPVGSYEANGFGLYDMHGNVREWVQDCQNGSYRGAPSNGDAWERGECGRRVLRGGSWINLPRYLRSANRGWSVTGSRYDGNGFRVARTLTP